MDWKFLKPLLFLIFLFWFLVVFQESFLSFFKIFGARWNLILIGVFILNFIERKNSKIGKISALLGGFFLDLASSTFFGPFTFTLLILSFLIKKLKKFFQESNILSFFLIFLFSFFFYKFSVWFFENIFYLFFQKNFKFWVNLNITLFLFEFLWNFLLLGVVFFFVKKYASFPKK